jgi:hypothetical protein
MLSNGVSGWLLMGPMERADVCADSEPTQQLQAELWRRGWDLNPRYPLRYVRFRGGSFQPLTHLSGETVVSCQCPVASKSEPRQERVSQKLRTTPINQRLTTTIYD